MNQKQTVRLLILGLLLCWCGIFLRGDDTAKSIVRAILLQEQEAGGWTAVALYQFPDAAADSAEAETPVRLCKGAGTCPEQALRDTEDKLPEEADYRLCDTLLLASDGGYEALEACAELFRQEPGMRLSCRVVAVEFSGGELLEASNQDPHLGERLLRQVQAASPAAPRLYEQSDAAGLLLPVLMLGEEISCRDEALLMTETGTTLLPADQTGMARALEGQANGVTLWVGDTAFRLCRSICGVETEDGGFVIRLALQLRAGSTRPTETQRRALERLCEQTVADCWANGADRLALGAFRARKNIREPRLTTRNACPALRAEVTVLG